MQNTSVAAGPSVQRCLRCSQELDELDPRPQCPYCGGLLELRHTPPEERGSALADLFRTSGSKSGVWRYGSLVLPNGIDAAVSWPEGNTPLISRKAIAAWVGVPALQIKHEGMNPTGSFKDRGMTVGVTQAVRVGATAVACASTGNTSASMAAYATLAEIPALVLVPLGKVSIGKLMQSIAYGAHTLMVRGDFDDCLRLVRESSEELGAYLLNSINPYRIEGQKTIVFEMLEQLDWDAPDWIALPAGNLGNTAAFGKALREAHELGLITKMPRLLAVQSDGAAPFAMSFRENFRVRHRVRANTIATAINIGAPASYQRAVQSIRETNGIVTSVSDGSIMEAKAIIDAAGVGCEPASAASVAGVKQMLLAGTITPDERVVCVLTGHVLKDPESLDRYHRGTEPPPAHANRPIEIEATVSAVAAVMRTLRAT